VKKRKFFFKKKWDHQKKDSSLVRLNLFQSSLVHVILLCRCFEYTNKKLPDFWTKEYMKGLSINFESLHFSSLILKGECSNCSLSLIVVINKAGRQLSIIIYTKTNNRIKLISSEKWSGYKQKVFIWIGEK
jgi:hypothetical protein